MNTQLTLDQSPASNTGILNTQTSLDYLSFTIPYSEAAFEKLKKTFDQADFTELSYGGMGYRDSAAILDGGRIFWHSGRIDMGIHIRLNASSLGMIEMTPLGILNRVYDWGGKLTRMDIAFDDMVGLLNVDIMYDKIRDGEIVTRWRKVTRLNGINVGNSLKTGDTLSVGSRASQAYLRIYDKKLERETKGFDVTGIDHWVRVELELKAEKADHFGKILAETARGSEAGSASQLCSNLLMGMIDFKDTDPLDSNKSRWQTARFWAEFVCATAKIKLSIPKVQKTLDDSKEWVQKTVSPTLAMIVLSRDDASGLSGYDFIMSCITAGQHRMTKTQERRLDLYNNWPGAKDGEARLSN